MKGLWVLAAATLVAAGCSNPNSVPAHSNTEEAAITELNKMTPEQQIERIQKGPMPESAKVSMIQKIKDKSGIK